MSNDYFVVKLFVEVLIFIVIAELSLYLFNRLRFKNVILYGLTPTHDPVIVYFFSLTVCFQLIEH